MLRSLSVSELNGYITGIFDAEELLHDIKVYGEISGLSNVRGNLYFSLKDENAIISCIMFNASSCSAKEGDQVEVFGSLRFYSKGGKLNLYVTQILPYGSGILFKKFQELKLKLEKEGVFDKKYKKPLPNNIKKIGVVSSATGAVIHDIITVSQRRNPLLNIDIYPSKVQGVGAEYNIVEGIKYFDKQDDIDVIIIARGGGSIEDLQPFNTEYLAREIIKISKPIISAVGHEVDFTICDFASSIRAATPSEAGEIVSKNIFDGLDIFRSKLDKLYFLTCSIIDDNFSKLENFNNKSNALIGQFVLKKQHNLQLLTSNLKNINFYNEYEKQLDINQNKLNLLNVASIIKRGFARVTKNGKVVKSVAKITTNDDIDLEFSDGVVSAKVINKKGNE